MLGLSVSGCVNDKLSDNAQDRMNRVVRQFPTLDVHVDLDFRAVSMRLNRLAYRICKTAFLECAASKVPQAVAQVFAAVLHLAPCRFQIWHYGVRIFFGGQLGCIQLQGYAGEILGDVVVQFNGEAGAFFYLQVGSLFRELLLC